MLCYEQECKMMRSIFSHQASTRSNHLKQCSAKVHSLAQVLQFYYLLFSIFQNCWSTQFALLVQLFFKREFPLHWHLINIAVGWNAVGNNASAHSVRFWKFFHSSPKCFVIRIIVSKLGDIGEVLGCTRFRHGGGSVQTE